MIIIAIAIESRSLSDKLYDKIKRKMNGTKAMTTSCRYPVYKAAKYLGWDGKLNQPGEKLITTIYNAGEEYDETKILNKTKELLSHIDRDAAIVFDVNSKKQIDMLKSIDGAQLILCSERDYQDDGLTTVIINKDDIDKTVKAIIDTINGIKKRR